MRVLSLFSGGGLGDYGLELAGMEIVGQVEIDEYCQKILKVRWPDVPKWKDIKKFDGKLFIKHSYPPDIISGGFPCQDISTAGKGVGITGERSGLWKEMFRIIREVRPRYVLVENVTALLGRGIGVVLGDLAEIGYDTEWDCIPASALGAPHQRDRVWIVGYTNDNGWNGTKDRQSDSQRENSYQKRSNKSLKSSRSGCEGKENVAYSRRKYEQRNSEGMEIKKTKWRGCILSTKPSCSRLGWNWAVEPNVGRVANGVANRVDRLKLLGNGQVVQVVQWIGERIMEFDNSLIERK